MSNLSGGIDLRAQPIRPYIDVSSQRTGIIMTGSEVVTGSTVFSADRYGPKYMFAMLHGAGSGDTDAALAFMVSMNNSVFVSTGSGTITGSNTPVCISMTEPWSYVYPRLVVGANGTTGSFWMVAKTFNS